MSRRILYRLLFLALLALCGIFVSVPSFFKGYPEWMKSIFPNTGMRLGLDLQGGMQLILKVALPSSRSLRRTGSTPPLRSSGLSHLDVFDQGNLCWDFVGIHCIFSNPS